ncbi:MAG: dihydrofolate reductase [Pedosphaera sp.]|nr:dihydrofolate reductase [Pedosphaera sp.]
MRGYKAIAAMSENRVIGAAGKLPWHLPEDFMWFKRMTMGQILVMGRKTFESIGKPLSGRETIVLSRSGFRYDGVRVLPDMKELDEAVEGDPREVFFCGGADIYRQALPLCSDLFLTRVKRVVAGDAFFPEFEDRFDPVLDVIDNLEFVVTHYRNRALLLA